MSYILLMNNGYPTKNNPKHSSYIHNIRLSLEEAGHRVDLLVLDSSFKSRIGHFIAYILYYLTIFKHNFTSYDYVLMNHFGFFFLPMFCKMQKVKQPVIHWHGEDLLPAQYIKAIVFKLFYAFGIPKRTKHITPSQYYKDLLMKKQKIDEKTISISPSGGIDINRFNITNQQKDYKGEIHLGFASALSTLKGMDFVLQLLKDKNYITKKTGKGIIFEYINYGSEKKYYSNELSKYNIRCWPPMTGNKMVEFYNSIDVLLFPTRKDSLGLVALETMSCEVPVIGPEAFAVKEYIINGVTGEKYESENYKSLLNAVIKCIKNLGYYSPRKLIEEKYSKQSVVKFYKRYFN